MLITIDAQAQIVIKEKVEINPQYYNNQAPTSGFQHTFTYMLTWTPSELRKGNIMVIDCNGDTINSGWATSGSTSITLPGNGSHYFKFQRQNYFYHNFHGWGWWESELLNENMQYCVDGNCENYNLLAGNSTVFGNYKLKLNGSLCPSKQVSMSLADIKIMDCNAEIPGWRWQTDPIHLQITEGWEFVSLFNILTGMELGNTAQTNYYEINNIKLIPKETAPEVNVTQTIAVEANINGYITISEFEYYARNFNIETYVYPDTLYMGESAYPDIVIYNYCGGLPSETKINLEIIKGQTLGSIINPITNEKTKALLELDHWGGYLWFEYVADGEAPKNNETVIIKVSTTDPEITPKELTLYLNPPPIYVYTIPEVVGVADTALIIIKKRNPDGTLEDFPAEQLFEIAATEGCINGNILVGDSLGVYFAAAQQPIYFVAADSIEGDSGYVRLRVGTDIESISTKPVTVNEHIFQKRKQNDLRITEWREGYKQMLEEKRQLFNKNEAEKKEEELIEGLIIEACFTGYFSEIVYWQGDVLVKKDGCDEYTCNEVIMKPSFTYESFPNGTFNADPCSTEQAKDTSVVAGITSVIWHEVNYLEYLKTENITACYEPVLGKWRFGTNKLLFPYFKIIMDVCLTNITNKGFKPLEDIADISDPAKWNDPNICEAKKDLEGHRSYQGKVRPGGYIFLEVTMAHEIAHGQDFQWVIDSLQNAFLYPTLDSLEIHCGKYGIENNQANNETDVKLIYFQYLQKVIVGQKSGGQVIYLGFEDRLYEGYNNHLKQSYTVNGITVDHENYINTRPIVVNTIDVLLNEFKNIWNCK